MARRFMTMENYTICNCMQVTRFDVEEAMHDHDNFGSVEEAFKEVQAQTQCSTGCGGCYSKILDAISDVMHGY